MNPKILEQAGLSKGETEIYLILLKIGEATVSEIARHTKIARPNVYDYVNKLKEKGLTSFVNKNYKTYYIPSPPEKIVDYVEEKKEVLMNNMDSLLKLYEQKKESAKIEIYDGAEGFKTLMNDIIKTKADFVGWGGSDKVKDYVPDFLVDRYLDQRKQNKIKGRMLYVETDGVLQTELTKFKKIPKEFSSPSTTLTYANKVAIMIYTAIPIVMIIKSTELADSYRKHFEMLWKTAKS